MTGWRQAWETACGEYRDMPVMVTAGAPYPRPMWIRVVKCERPKGHDGWHSCDGASWAPDLPKSPSLTEWKP